MTTATTGTLIGRDDRHDGFLAAGLLMMVGLIISWLFGRRDD